MKSLLIISSLILGTVATVPTASAQPWPYNDPHFDRNPYVDDYSQIRPRGRWVQLASHVPNTSNREFIPVGTQAGRFDKLMFDVDRGSVLVRQVVIQFGNGRQQKVRVDRYVNAGHGGLIVDLPGRRRAIQRVIIYTEPGRRGFNRGRYSVYAA